MNERKTESLRYSPRGGRQWIWCAAGAAIAVAAGAVWLDRGTRAKASRDPSAPPDPVVAVTRVDREDLYNEIELPAEFRPYMEDELHAKISGYVDQMKVDFGDRVKKGQLLATIEVPELADQLLTAQAALAKAQADQVQAELAYTRLRAVSTNNPGMVTPMELDTAEAKFHASKAAVMAAKADAQRYQQLNDYTNIFAPFDGVITWRYADPGALIQAGISSDTQSRPLVRISDNYRLRLDVPVSVGYVKDIHEGDPVEVRVGSLNNKRIAGVVRRVTHEVSDDTRTMIVETEAPNPNLEIVPGMYAKEILRVARQPHALAVPIQAVSMDNGQPRVYVVNAKHEVEERSITTGLETPEKYQVVSGLREGEMVIVGNLAMLQPGQKVQPKIVPLAIAEK